MYLLLFEYTSTTTLTDSERAYFIRRFSLRNFVSQTLRQQSSGYPGNLSRPFVLVRNSRILWPFRAKASRLISSESSLARLTERKSPNAI